MDVRIPPLALKRCLLGCVVILSLGGLGVELAGARWPMATDDLPLPYFSLSYEQNLPTWFSSHLILLCGFMLALVSFADRGHGAKFWRHWRGLAFVFAYISLDEATEIHEGLNLLFDTSGVLYFGWIIPFGVLVSVLVVVYWRFLWQLPERTRLRFIGAGALYVGGALLVELPLGYWAELHGSENLTYALLDWLEETMEICGMSLFAWAVASFLEEGGLNLSRADGDVIP